MSSAKRILGCAGAVKLHCVPAGQRWALLCFVGVGCVLHQQLSGFVTDGGNGARCTGQDAACSDLVNKALCLRWEIDCADIIVKVGRIWVEFSP